MTTITNAQMKYDADIQANYYKGTTPAAPPATFYVALITTLPTKNDGTGLVECSDSAYARQPIAASTGWSTISLGADNYHENISNAAAINFPACAGAGYTVVGLAVYDALTGGNLRRCYQITAQPISTGNGYDIAIGGLVLGF